MHPRSRVIAAVIRRNGKFLVCQRPRGKRHEGLWEFPGGKFLPGETLLDAARRELGEELGLTVRRIGEIRLAVPDPGSPFVIEFVDVDADGEPIPHEHQAVAWHTPVELLDMPLAPSDHRFLIHWVSLNE